MNILCVLCRDPFEQQDGGTYVIRASLEGLSGKGQVCVTGFGPTFAEPARGGYACRGSLGPNSNSVRGFVNSLVRRRPFSLDKYGSAEAQARFEAILAAGRFDLVWYEQTQAAAVAFLSGELHRRAYPCMHVLRSHNVEFQVVTERQDVLARLGRPLLLVESARLREFELRIANSVDRVLTVTREDQRTLLDEGEGTPRKVLHLPVPAKEVHRSDGVDWGERRTVLFVGKCAWGPNLAAAIWIRDHLAPAVERALPGVRIRLVGQGTEALAARSRASNLSFAGFVPSLAAELGASLCTIAPVQTGGGINVKVVESLAHGVPVIGTRFARRGIDSEAYLEADTVGEFVERLRTLAERPEVAAGLSRDAWASAERSRSRFGAVLEEALGWTRGLEDSGR
jgi:glycosyltransferase involved in cell wall biosynthesis